jgi:hypothetical protein
MSSKNKAIEGDGHHTAPKATEDDVEGHSMLTRAVESDGAILRKATEDDDVEGHGFKARSAVESDGAILRKATEDDDVEGHAFKSSKAVEPDGHHTAPKASEDDDVEGHNIGVMNPILARELARARERDVQREASRNSLIGEAKRALGRKR